MKPDPFPRTPNRLATGLLVSLAVHALLILGYQFTKKPATPEPRQEKRFIAVWVQPPKPKEAPKPADASPRKTAQRSSTPAPRIIALAPKPAEPAPMVLVPAAPPTTPEAAPVFDREAAMKTARAMANEPDRPGTAVGQLPRAPLAAETKEARAIASAKRRDCKDGLPGGLLAPLFLLMDKKDSGCKW
ncbi:MAG: hypothetical protein V4463_15160 [Pseudomonadota bacterium]